MSYCIAACQSSVSRASDPESAQLLTPPDVYCTFPSETEILSYYNFEHDVKKGSHETIYCSTDEFLIMKYMLISQ